MTRRELITLFCDTYKTSMVKRQVFLNENQETMKRTNAYIQTTILSKKDEKTHTDKVILKEIGGFDDLQSDLMVYNFDNLKRKPPRIKCVDDVYILFAFLRECGFEDIVSCSQFLNQYMPYKMMATPYNRDEVIKARYTSMIKDDKIYLIVPGTLGATKELLNQEHLNLAIEQKNKII